MPPETTTYADWVEKMVGQYGVPSAVLFVLVALIVTGMWRTAVWAAKNIATPLVERMLKLIDTLQASSGDQTKILADINLVIATLGKENNQMLKELLSRSNEDKKKESEREQREKLELERLRILEREKDSGRIESRDKSVRSG